MYYDPNSSSQYFIGVTLLAMIPEIPEIVNGVQFALQNQISLRSVCSVTPYSKLTCSRHHEITTNNTFCFIQSIFGWKIHAFCCFLTVSRLEAALRCRCAWFRSPSWFYSTSSMWVVLDILFSKLAHWWLYVSAFSWWSFCDRMLALYSSSATCICGPASLVSSLWIIVLWMESVITFKVRS